MPGFIDARGKACPMPVVLAKQQLDKGEQKLTVMVDNETAVENLKRLASHCGAETEVEYRTDGIAVIFNGGNADTEQKIFRIYANVKKEDIRYFSEKIMSARVIIHSGTTLRKWLCIPFPKAMTHRIALYL